MGTVRDIGKPAGNGPEPGTFGARLRAARKAVPKLTQAKLATRIKMDLMTINRVELNKQPPSARMLAILYETLGGEWMADAEREAAIEQLRSPATDDDNLSPFEVVKHDQLYTTARPLARAHYDVGLARVPSSIKSRDEQIAFYKEWLVQLRAQERSGTLGPVNALRKGETIDPEPDE